MNIWKFKFKEKGPFINTIAPKTMKYLGINLTKCVQHLYTEIYKTLMREIKALNKWRNILCSWTGKLNIVKMSLFLKSIYSLNTMPIKILFYFVELTS